MMEKAKFKIDDHVKSKDSAHIEGYVIDALFSESSGWTYRVQMNSQVIFQPEDNLELVKEYSVDIKIDIADNVVIATLHESVGGGAEASEQRTRSSDPRRRVRNRTGSKLCLLQTDEERGGR